MRKEVQFTNVTFVEVKITTPMDDGEQEKEFKLKAKEGLKLGLFLDRSFLNYDKEADEIMISSSSHDCNYRTIFTDSQLKEFFTPTQLKWIEMTFDKEWI